MRSTETARENEVPSLRGIEEGNDGDQQMPGESCDEETEKRERGGGVSSWSLV